jgi:hypothetical protein
MSTTLVAPPRRTCNSRPEPLRLSPVARVSGASREGFRRDFLEPRRPVVLTDLAASWPALTRWTPEFLAREHGDKRIEVYDTSFARPGRHYMSNLRTMTFAEFLDCVLHQDMDLRMFLYNIARRIPELRRDIHMPEIASGFSERFVFMFFGCRGSVTPTHYDIDMSHVFHTAIRGRKRITLFSPGCSRRLHRHPLTVRSYVDIDAPDVERFPRLDGVPGAQVTLVPGETLFIPAGYWHHVVYEEGGYAVSWRLGNERPGARLQGYVNLLLASPADRALNALLGTRWHRIKSGLAGERGVAEDRRA